MNNKEKKYKEKKYQQSTWYKHACLYKEVMSYIHNSVVTRPMGPYKLQKYC